MFSRSSLAFAMFLLATSALAQNRMPSGFIRIGPAHTAHARHPFFPAYGYYGVPYGYSEYEVEYAPAEPAPIPAPVMQVKTEPVPDPELLELHGTEWVRVSKFNTAGNSSATVQISAPLPPAVLVFHDGRSEEVNSYSIIGDSIYTKANYWNTGKWTETIRIADLDVAATMQRNRERGIKFELPSSPDEIMIRP